MKRIAIAMMAALLASCVSQNEMALSQNVYKIDVDASGLIGINEARNTMDKRIAQSTVSKGFTHYIIQQAGSQSGTEYAGSMPVYARTNVNVIGNTAYGNTTYSGGQPIMRPTSQTSVVVAMYRAPNVPAGAIDAGQVLARQKK